MQIIHEVPGTFRILLVRDVSRGVGDMQSTERATPFVLTYRVQGVDAAEHVELNDDLFRLLLTMDRPTALLLNRYLPAPFQMSDGMLNQLRDSPTSVLQYAKTSMIRQYNPDKASESFKANLLDLRRATELPLMECKNALFAAKGNYDEAKRSLRWGEGT